jgi:hypothetical protein
MANRSDREEGAPDAGAGRQTLNRRGLLRRAGRALGVAGVGAVAGPALMGQAAQAASGQPLVLGQNNTSDLSTGLICTGEAAALGISCPSVALFAESTSSTQPAVVVHAGDGPAMNLQARASDAMVQAVNNGTGTAIQCSGGIDGAGLDATGSVGVTALGFTNGIVGRTSSSKDSGVWGHNVGGGYGVSGSTAAAAAAGVWGNNTGSGPGVRGTATSAAAAGVWGDSPLGDGVRGTSSKSNGVHGSAANAANSGVWGENTAGGYGVSGSTNSRTAAGVWGLNSGAGDGVRGSAPNGVGVHASGQTALEADGKAVFNGPTAFSRSGTVVVAAGAASATKTGIPLDASSLVLVTVQGNRSGVWVQGVTKTAGTSGSFTVHLNRVTATALTVAWFVIN